MNQRKLVYQGVQVPSLYSSLAYLFFYDSHVCTVTIIVRFCGLFRLGAYNGGNIWVLRTFLEYLGKSSCHFFSSFSIKFNLLLTLISKSNIPATVPPISDILSLSGTPAGPHHYHGISRKWWLALANDLGRGFVQTRLWEVHAQTTEITCRMYQCASLC